MEQLKRRTFWRVAAVILLMFGGVIASQIAPWEDWLVRFIGWSERWGAAGKLIFTAVYVVAMVACLWGTPFTVAAGLAFGVWWGTVVATAGATGGSAAAFLIARHLARERLARWAEKHRNFQAVDKALERGGWKIVFLTRFSPIVPFSVSNYLFGLSRIRFGAFFWASLLAILPGSFVVAYLSHLGRISLTGGMEEFDGTSIVLMTVAFGMTVAAVVYFTFLARRQWAAIHKEESGGG